MGERRHAGDVDGIRAPDLIAVDPGAGQAYGWENQATQAERTTADVSPATASGGFVIGLFELTTERLGRAGDADGESAALDLLFEETASDPLTPAKRPR